MGSEPINMQTPRMITYSYRKHWENLSQIKYLNKSEIRRVDSETQTQYTQVKKSRERIAVTEELEDNGLNQ